ncbi:MAG: DUF3857 domain-containing protein [Burkholderiaceae bacterium]
MQFARLLACATLTWVTLAVFAQEVPVGTPPAPRADREIQIASDAFVKDARLPGWVQPLAIPEPKAAGAAVLALSDTQILVGDQTTEYARRAIRIDDASVLSSAGRVPLAFIPAYQHMVLHALQVIRDGVVLDRLADAQVRFLQRETGLENNIYSGVVTASILIDDLRVGDTLVVAYSTIGQNPIFGSIFSGAANWDQGFPIELRRVILNEPAQRRVGWKAHGLVSPAIPAPTEKIVDGMRIITFEGRSIAALPPEPGVPAGVSLARWIEFSEYADWNAVATWASTLFVDTEPPSAERVALVARLMTRPTIEERVVGALEFVQSQVRYFSVSLGTSSHRPTLPNTVITRRYGDCKDKSLLLVTLLRDMGIASAPVLARLGNRTGFDDWIPSPLAFDHVIVRVEVDGVPYFLDATRMGQHGRLAKMGQVHDGSQVLVASSTTPGLERISVADRDALAREDRDEKLVMTKLDGDGELTVTQIQHGALAETLRTIRGALTQERIDTVITTDITKRYPGAKLIEPVRFDDDPVDNSITLSYRVTLPKPMKRSGATWQVPFRPENLMAIFGLPPDTKRRAPVAIRWPINAHYSFEATFPDDVGATFDPSSVTIEDPVFMASSETTFRGNRSTAKAGLRTISDRIAPGGLPRLREDLTKFQRSFPGAVVIRDADIRKSGVLGLGRKDLATTLRARQEETIAKVSGAIESGRLTGADLAGAYCARAAAYVTLDRTSEATADADQSVEADPDAPNTLTCRGEIRLGVRAYAAAIEDLSRAVVLGAEGGRVYYLRGQARFHLGRYAEAADDFAKANAVDRNERSTMNHDLWRAMAFLRMKKPLPDDLQKRAEADPRGEWPRPALALFADRLAPDELGPLAARKPGDAAELNGTEADFFLGEFFLARGDAAKARDAFTAARARGVITYTEYGAAGIELDKLARQAP